MNESIRICVSECRRLLTEATHFTDDEVIALRDNLYDLASCLLDAHDTCSHARNGETDHVRRPHLRRVVGEAAWAYRHRPAVGAALRKRQATVSADVNAIAWKAQHRCVHEAFLTIGCILVCCYFLNPVN